MISKRFDRVIVLAVLWGLGLGSAARPVQAFSNPNDFCTGDPCIISANKNVDAVVGGLTLDFGMRTVILQRQLTIDTLPSGAVGTVTIKAGTFQITTSNGFIKASSSSAPAGSVTIDVVNSIQLNGTTAGGDLRLSGLGGGTLTLKTAMGSITGGGRINLFGDGALYSGGTLNLTSGADINLTGNIDIHGNTQGGGGNLDIASAGNAAITGFVDISGGQGGGGFIDATVGGNLTFGVMEMSGSGEDADAGIVTLYADGNINFNGKITGRGSDISDACGDGADIDVIAVGTITVAADMDIKGRGLDCAGGFLALDGDIVYLQSLLDMGGTGTQGEGGDLDVAAITLIRQTGTVQLDGGDGGAGDFFYLCDNAVEIIGNVNANGRSTNSPGSALVEIDAGILTVSGDINASGGVNTSGGDITLAACDVIVTSTADLISLGQLGEITIEASDTAQLHGHFTADLAGGIEIDVNSRSFPPDTTGAVFSPAPVILLVPALIPCRICETNAHCADTNDCTVDTCVPSTGCSHTPLNSGPCNDGNQCTMNDQCSAGTCGGGPVNTCDDSNQCTLDSCVPATGCAHTLQPGSCNDGNACTTGDNCSSGSCAGTPINCSDGNPCTDDVCTAGVCSNPPNTTPCNTATPTKTPTATPTNTLTATPTKTATATPTTTPTGTPTQTPTQTPTRTSTRPSTATPTNTPPPAATTAVPSPTVVLDPISSPILIGATRVLTGQGFTAGSRIVLFVADLGGVAAYGPFVPTARTPTSLTWFLPTTFSASGGVPPPPVLPGNGFATVVVVNTDQGFIQSDARSQLIYNAPSTGIPSVLSINGVNLSPAVEGVPVGNVETFVSQGATVTIGGTAFSNPVVNLFTATGGNFGPLTPLPGASSTQFQVVIPANTPTGPGALQVVNVGPFTISNAVSVPIGAVLSISSITQAGNVVTVTGTGFCPVTVINLFNGPRFFGGFGPQGPNIPLTVSSSTQFSFTVPAGAVSGSSYVQAINPPFIPFSSSGSDPDGLFNLTAP